MVDAFSSFASGEWIKRWWEKWAIAFVAARAPGRRRRLEILAWVLVAFVAVADYLTGFEITLRFAYTVPIAIITAARGRRRGLMLAVVSDAAWQTADVIAGAHYSSLLVPLWNLSITMMSYLWIVWVLGAFLDLQRHLEDKVLLRTAALSEEIIERERLEREITSISEKERWSIGHDLHDGICQNFTATAMAAQVLARRLERDFPVGLPEARRVVTMIEDGIGQTRRVAKGLLLVTVEEDGLNTALREMVQACGEQFRAVCEFEEEGESLVAEILVATHLFRIAQEAMRNAARHGQAKKIKLRVSSRMDWIHLQISDNGVGIADESEQKPGLGLRIMTHRARMIGADFSVVPQPLGGTLVTCRWPALQEKND